MGDPISVGILGCGSVTQLLHLPALAQIPDRFRVAALCDISPRVLEGVGARWNVAQRFVDPAALIAARQVEAVLVATPHVHHADLARAAMAAGKHVLIEKPHCLTLGEADDLIATEARAGVIAQVGYMRRYAPALGTAKALLGPHAEIRFARVSDIIGANALIVDSTSHVIRADDISADFIERAAALQAERVAAAIGAAPPALAAAYVLLAALASHDISAMRELIGRPRRVASAAQHWNGRFITATFDYGHFVCQFAAGVDQIGRMDAFLEVNTPARLVRVDYDTPFVRNLPARLTITEPQDRVGVSRTDGFSSRQDSFVLEWLAFHDAIVSGRAPKTSLADAREDLGLFVEIIEHMRRPH
ncbi:MAG: Gfo/Idh/MocA family oxidoreductase [Alphaproteobacteria bacterium]|nr:Gfo/Idh/MocA family oxidoreductase [Alphaproteobacteria bacterium]